MFEKSSINQAVNSVYKALQNQLIKTYNMEVEESEIATDTILSIHGMSKADFSVIDKIETFISSKVNDNSIDDNSNKTEKTIKGILKEAENPFDKMAGYRFLYRKMADIYGKKEAKHLTSLMYDYTLALADSTNILVPYCWAFDASKIVTMGKLFGPLKSMPVKRVDSYISLLNEVVHQMSNHLAGAIAVGTFFLDISHLLLIREGKNLDDLKDKKYRKYIKNQFQRMVHGFNSLSRSGGVESPFTNISLFDREKLKKLVGDEYAWYFMDIQGEEKYSTDYIIEFIIELQNIYMEFFDEGDPMNDGLPYRFPVSTLNISKKRNKEGEWVIEDKKFLKSSCKKDIYRYNLFVSEGEKIASCCRLISNAEMAEFASQSNSFGAGGSISLGSHRIVTVNLARLALMANTKEEFYYLFKTHIENSKKILFSHKELLKELKDLQIFIKQGWIQLERLFSTVGIMGYIECEEILKKKKIFNNNEDALLEIIEFLDKEVQSNNENYTGCFFNVEQIPGESMCHRLAKVDKLLYGEKLVPYNIYANQFVPLWDTSKTLWERMETSGRYLQKLTGGGIDHINTGEHITGQQAEELIKYAVQVNAEHFAITGTFSKCEDGHVAIGNTNKCTICGKDIIYQMARTVGFWVEVDDMNFNKQQYDHARRREFKNGDFDKQEVK